MRPIIIFIVAQIWTAVALMTASQAQPEDSLRTTSLWQFDPEEAVGAGQRGFGMIPLFADGSQTQIGAINFYCVIAGGYPYLDIFAYKSPQPFPMILKNDAGQF
jgi:hypothetical protein